MDIGTFDTRAVRKRGTLSGCPGTDRPAAIVRVRRPVRLPALKADGIGHITLTTARACRIEWPTCAKKKLLGSLGDGGEVGEVEGTQIEAAAATVQEARIRRVRRASAHRLFASRILA